MQKRICITRMSILREYEVRGQYGTRTLPLVPTPSSLLPLSGLLPDVPRAPRKQSEAKNPRSNSHTARITSLYSLTQGDV